MFERFSSASRRGGVEAEAEARRLDHGFIGTEHLTLALAGPAAAGHRANDLLVGAGIDIVDLRQAVVAPIGSTEDVPGELPIPFTPRSKKVLELSLREALAMNRPAIEP